jgi:hypothetical protein
MCGMVIQRGVREGGGEYLDRRRQIHVSPARGELLEADILHGGVVADSDYSFRSCYSRIAQARPHLPGRAAGRREACQHQMLASPVSLSVQHQLSTHARPTTRVSPPIHHAICPPADPAARRFTCHRPQHHKISDLLSKELQKSSSLCSNQTCDRSTYTHIFG